MISFKVFCKLFLLVAIAMIIVAAPPVSVCFCLKLAAIPVWLNIIAAIIVTFFSLFAGLKFIDKATDKFDFFE